MLFRVLFCSTILCLILDQCNLTYGATTTVRTTTTKRATAGNTTTTRRPTTNANRNSTRIITVRIGGEGEQQCQCTLFYQCDSVNTIEVPAGGMTCDENYVCCRLPIPPETGATPTPSTSFPVTDPSVPLIVSPNIPTNNDQPNCTCVLSNQCSRTLQDVLGGGGLLDPRVTACDNTQVCCVVLAPGFGGGTSPTEPNFPGSTNPPDQCVCVPTSQCQRNDQEVAGGFGIIDPKRPCDTTEICCPPNSVIPTPIPPTTEDPPQPPPPSQPPVCGVRRNLDVGVKIVGAANTTFGEFPWMALLLSASANANPPENIFVCGASLLSSSIILTAAHCVQDQDINLLKVRAGEYDIHIRDTSNEPLAHQERSVSQIIQHQNFNSRVLYNDIALIVVNEPFNFADHISPICAPFLETEFAGSGIYNPNSCVATGWGKNAFENQEYHTVLKRVDLGIVERNECQARLRNTRLGQYFVLDPSFMCAGGLAGYDTCEGDGGGPLVCALTSDPNRYVQVGIVSWGIGCGNETPGVYASLEANIDWLSEQFNTLSIFSAGDPLSSRMNSNTKVNNAIITRSNNSLKPQANNNKKPNSKATSVKQ